MHPANLFTAAEGLRFFGAGFFYFATSALVALAAPTAFAASLASAMLHLSGFLALPLGAVADRIDRRRGLVGVALLQSLLIWPLALGQGLALWALYLLIFVFQAVDELRRVAGSGVLARLVPREKLEEAFGRLDVTFEVVDTLNTPLAGWLFTRSPILIAPVGAVCILASALLYRALPPTPPPKAQPFQLSEVLEGLRFLLQHPKHRRILAEGGLLSLAYSGAAAMLAFWVLRSLGQTAWELALIETAFGLGVVAGSLLIGRVLVWGRERAMRMGLFLGGACLFIPALLHLWYLWALGFFLFALFAQFFILPASALRLADAPDELRGRVSGSVGFLSDVMALIGTLLAGVLATFNPWLPLYLFGGVLLGLGLVRR
jgi:predicted MFS family arabinose efflux permease